jgi:hypothetical protein
MSKDLTQLLSDLQLTENNAVSYFKDDGWKSVVSKETQNKLQIIQPTAFYIFNKQPYILFFDLTENTDVNRTREIHKQVWSFDQAPVIFIIYSNSIETFNAFQLEKDGALAKIDENEAINNCNFWKLQSGDMFEWFQNKYKATLKKKRVNQRLFENIKQTIKILVELNLPEKEAKLLVLRLIFIRYLIDRKIRIDNTFIEGHENDVITRRKSLSNLINKPEAFHQFSIYLNGRFNGILFQNDSILDVNQAKYLSLLFDPSGINNSGDTNLFNGTEAETEFYYNIFDFGIIPVELISGIYESILDPETKDSTAAVYTPPFLVDYALTETVDKFFVENENLTECKIFDPSMGSGIYVVQAFRRMVDCEIARKEKQKINKSRLSEIANNNLFGIDINEEAINVACFSIYVAMLDYLDPADIDDIDHRFPTLKFENFYKINFFTPFNKQSENIEDGELLINGRALAKLSNKNFDFILGNAPWDKNKEELHINWLNDNQIYSEKVKGEKEIAVSYLMRIGDFMTENTVCSLVVTSTIFYNVADPIREIKSKFFKKYSVLSILDLSPVRRLVFEGEKTKKIFDTKTGVEKFSKAPITSPATVINFKKYNSNLFNNYPIHFKSIKQNKFFNKSLKNLVIEKFDYKEIQQKHFIENDWMSKVALYGNTLDFIFIKKLNQNKNKLLSLIDGKIAHKGSGILRGTPKDYYDNLIGLPNITNRNVNHIFTSNIDKPTLKKDDVFLESGRKINLFEGFKILIKEQAIDESYLGISYTEGTSVFWKGVFGIASFDKNFIDYFYSILISDIFTYYIFCKSGSWGTSTRPQIRLDEEYLSFPYKEPTESQKDLLISLVNQLLQPYKDFYNTYPDSVYSGEPDKNVLDEINEIIYEIYEIKPHERDLIDYVLNVSRYQFQDKKESQKKVSEFNESDPIRNKRVVIEQYIKIFKEQLQAVYNDEAIEVEVYELKHFTALNFKFDDTKPSSWKINPDTKDKDEKSVLETLSKLSISQITTDATNEHNLFIQKDIKGFEENSFYIIKPNEYKCWHRAMAWYDVAEIREAILGAEIGRIKGRSFSE